MSRRSQVTIFIILGLVLLIIFSIFFFVIRANNKIKLDSSNDYEEIFYFANSCMESSAKQSVWESFDTGFYDKSDDLFKNKFITYNETFYNPQNNSQIYILTKVKPTYLDKGTSQVPDIKTVEKILIKNFDEYFNVCLNSSDFEKIYEEFTVEYTSSKIELNDETTIFNKDIKLKIKNKKEEESTSRTLTYTLNYPLKTKYEYAKDFIKSQSREEDFILGQLSYLAKVNNFQYSITYYDESTLIFDFIFDDYGNIYGDKLRHGFAIKYDWK